MLREGILLAAVIAVHTVIGAKCPDRGYLTKKYDDSCIEFINEATLYPQAKRKCEAHNGHVVTIEDQQKQDWLENSIADLDWVDISTVFSKSSIWIGIKRTESDEQGNKDDTFWYYDTKSSESQHDSVPIKYKNWGAREPDKTKDRNCAIMMGYKTGFQWAGQVCSQNPFTHLVVCQYDGPEGFLSNPAFAITIIVVITAMIIGGAVLLYNCYIRRKALRRQLREEKDGKDMCFHEYHISNTDNDINGDHPNINMSSNNNYPINHYAPVTSNSHHDFNILTDSLHQHDKLLRKDLSLQNVSTPQTPSYNYQAPEYSRSVSAPANSLSPYAKASAPATDFSVVVEEEEHNIHDSNESSPLHLPRVDSEESNNMCV